MQRVWRGAQARDWAATLRDEQEMHAQKEAAAAQARELAAARAKEQKEQAAARAREQAAAAEKVCAFIRPPCSQNIRGGRRKCLRAGMWLELFSHTPDDVPTTQRDPGLLAPQAMQLGTKKKTHSLSV